MNDEFKSLERIAAEFEKAFVDVDAVSAKDALKKKLKLELERRFRNRV